MPFDCLCCWAGRPRASLNEHWQRLTCPPRRGVNHVRTHRAIPSANPSQSGLRSSSFESRRSQKLSYHILDASRLATLDASPTHQTHPAQRWLTLASFTTSWLRVGRHMWSERCTIVGAVPCHRALGDNINDYGPRARFSHDDLSDN